MLKINTFEKHANSKRNLFCLLTDHYGPPVVCGQHFKKGCLHSLHYYQTFQEVFHEKVDGKR